MQPRAGLCADLLVAALARLSPGAGRRRSMVCVAGWAVVFALIPSKLCAQDASPWIEVANVLQAAFTHPTGRGLSLVAIVMGGLMFAFGEGGWKRTVAGVIFALGATSWLVTFLTWL